MRNSETVWQQKHITQETLSMHDRPLEVEDTQQHIVKIQHRRRKKRAPVRT